ncbi:glycosyltransferase [Cyclobacteriaceae bacterium]|nr:glycosyltransferase [Cyclobacteriaceae bacterium]
MKSFSKILNQVISNLLLTPYYWYCRIKEIPGFLDRFSIYKPTNKERIQKYNNWLVKKSREAAVTQKQLQEKKWLPTFSILLIGNHFDASLFQKTLESISKINYFDFQLLICGVSPSCFDKIKEEYPDLNAIYNPEKADIDVEYFNILAKQCNTDYMFVLQEGDEVESQIFTAIANKIITQPNIDLIYFDEGKVNLKGLKYVPNFKPKWSPHQILSHNYIKYGVVFRTSIFHSIGQFDTQYRTAYLFDSILKITESTDKIEHLSGVLFHKLSSNQSEHQLSEEQKIIESALKRRQLDAQLQVSDERNKSFSIKYATDVESKVSIIIPSRDQGNILNQCLKSIFERTTYSNIEIIIIDNGSTEKLFFEVVKKWQQKFEFDVKVLPHDIPFNFSRLNNLASKEATGEYLLFLNNDVEVISPDWINDMLAQAQQPMVGAVGAKLLFPNDEIQHAGVFLGVGGIASHPFAKTPNNGHRYINTTVNYSALTGACLMISKKLYDDVKGFNEEFKVEFNDLDLCLKLKKLGYHNIYLPHVELYHYESYSRGRKHKNLPGFLKYRKERAQFYAQWHSYIENDPSYNQYLNKDLTQLFEPRLD